MSDIGMGIQGESGGLLMGGKGLKDVGLLLLMDQVDIMYVVVVC